MELFESFNGGWDFDMTLDIICQDLLDTPFGGGMEIGRLGDTEDGRVVWAQHLDAATLFPTRDFDFPIAQRVPDTQLPVVLFPRHTFNRMFYTPRPEWQYMGWGMPPPEKGFLAIDLLFRGDRYYANLLLDTPEAGILDLLDMSKDAAMEWLESFKDLFTGVDPFKVPVLYEHERAAEWIPFGRPPIDLIYDSITFKYAQITCAAYGLKISDIGLSQEEARTLAGVIRAERQTRRTGFATLKAKTGAFFRRLLPKHLTFEWLDKDDESMLARGRSRLANFQAYGEAREKRMLTLKEIRAQIATDGLLDIQIDPDDPEALAMDDLMMGPDVVRPPRTDDRDRVPPSDGGQGQLTFPKKSLGILVSGLLLTASDNLTRPRLRRLSKAIARELFPSVSKVFKEMPAIDLEDWSFAMTEAAFDENGLDKKSKKAFERKKKVLDKHLDADGWWAIKNRFLAEEDFGPAAETTYMAGIELARSLVAEALYEGEITDDPSTAPSWDKGGQGPSARNSIIELVDKVDSDTIRLVKAACLASCCQAFAVPTVYQSIQAGTSVEDLLGDPVFLDYFTGVLKDTINEVYRARITAVADQINRALIELSAKDFFTQIGLGKGDWTLEEGKLSLNETKLLTIADRKDFLR